MSFLRRLLGRADGARASGAEQIEKWVREAYGHAAAGDQAEAVRLFKQALEHDPECVEALYFLASAAGREGLAERAHKSNPIIEMTPRSRMPPRKTRALLPTTWKIGPANHVSINTTMAAAPAARCSQ